MFNLDRQRLISNAAVKHQCSGSYFYGDNQKEDALQFMEQSYASTLRHISEAQYKALNVRDEIVLRRFWLLQFLRTDASSRRAVEMNNHLGDVTGAGGSFRKLRRPPAFE